MSFDILQPTGWKRPSGYANGVAARGRMVFVAGQIGWNARQELVGPSFVEQLRQALDNVRQVLAQAGAEPRHIVRLTWFITSAEEYGASLSAIGIAYGEVMGRHFPAMSVVQVAALLEPGAKVEIEATAVLPD